MIQSSKLSRTRFTLPFVCGLLLFAVGLATCSPPSDVTVQQPVAVAAQQGPQPAGDMSVSAQPFVAVARQAKAAVINISSAKKSARRGEEDPLPFFDDPFFRRFFGQEFQGHVPTPREHQEQGLGSGVIVTTDGYIVTNNHVVEGADELTVSLPDKRTFKAKVIGTDPKTDVAVIKIDASNLSVLPWGDARQLEVGEMVLAIGNPFGLSQTVTMGIISAVGRANVGIVDYEDFIQTDAPINPGNSGGALVNINGEVVGINTAIASPTGGSVGVGFAIPSNMARAAMQSLLKTGRVVRGFLGASTQDVSPSLGKIFRLPDVKGAIVTDVQTKGSAERETKRRFSIRLCENAVLIVSGARRWLRGPLRSGPTIPLLSVPIAIDWESPKPKAGE